MDGISLTFDDDGNAEVESSDLGQRCFGNVLCKHCTRKVHELGYEQIWCEHKNCSVTDFDGKCPLGYWVKLAVPIGYHKIKEKTWER